MSSLRITYRKSTIGYSEDQKATMRSLGFRKLNQVVIRPDTAALRGMVFKVRHLVTVEELEGDAPAQPLQSNKRPATRPVIIPPSAIEPQSSASNTQAEPPVAGDLER